MDIEDIQADERHEAIDNLTDYVVAVMKNIVYNIGGDEESFINLPCAQRSYRRYYGWTFRGNA